MSELLVRLALQPVHVTGWWLLLLPAFAFADGFNGGQFGWNQLKWDAPSGKGFLHGRGMYYVALPLVALCLVLGGWKLAASAVAWCVYRGAFGFSDNTLTGRAFGATVLRHAIVWPIGLGLSWGFDWDVAVWAPWIMYTAVAVTLASWFGDNALDSEHPQDFNYIVEPTRGLMYAACTVASVWLGLRA